MYYIIIVRIFAFSKGKSYIISDHSAPLLSCYSTKQSKYKQKYPYIISNQTLAGDFSQKKDMECKTLNGSWKNTNFFCILGIIIIIIIIIYLFIMYLSNYMLKYIYMYLSNYMLKYIYADKYDYSITRRL